MRTTTIAVAFLTSDQEANLWISVLLFNCRFMPSLSSLLGLWLVPMLHQGIMWPVEVLTICAPSITSRVVKEAWKWTGSLQLMQVIFCSKSWWCCSYIPWKKRKAKYNIATGMVEKLYNFHLKQACFCSSPDEELKKKGIENLHIVAPTMKSWLQTYGYWLTSELTEARDCWIGCLMVPCD